MHDGKNGTIVRVRHFALGIVSCAVTLTAATTSWASRPHSVAISPPPALTPFNSPAQAGEGHWKPAGRLVDGSPAIYTTLLRPAQNPTAEAGVAWIDQSRLHARLYSGSLSPGGYFWKLTAPISHAASKTLVAAFAGGFLLKDSHGGYLSEGHLVAALVRGAASLVIYRNGSIAIGSWGRDLAMRSSVVAVRQNLTLLVDHGSPVPGLYPYDTSTWGSTLHQVVDVPRSALGITASGALVYAEGSMNIVDLASMMVRAGAIRAMVLDMNPLWPVFATYAPSSPNGYATPANGKDLTPSMVQKPDRFFQTRYARDFITLSLS